MAAVSIGLGAVAAIRFGAVGVVCAAALAIFAAQVLPDLLWVPRLVHRRPPTRRERCCQRRNHGFARSDIMKHRRVRLRPSLRYAG